MSNIVNMINYLNHNHCNFVDLVKMLIYLECKENKIEIQFLSSLSHKFPKTEVEIGEIEKYDANTFKIKCFTDFLSLIGATGILPSHYTEYIITLSKEKDKSLLDFINIFYDKIIKLFIKIIKKSNIYLEYEAHVINQRGYGKQNWAFIYSLIGISHKNNKVIPDSLLSYAGLLINTSRPSSILKTILINYLQLPVEIEEFIKEKQKLDEKELSKLGKVNNCLTNSLYLGCNAYFFQNKVIIRILDLDLKTYEQFLTDALYRKPLEQILTFYLKDNLSFKIIFLVKDSEKATWLSTKVPRKLGITIWCKI
jgi:type VI secretion system protein ImpH